MQLNVLSAANSYNICAYKVNTPYEKREFGVAFNARAMCQLLSLNLFLIILKNSDIQRFYSVGYVRNFISEALPVR